MFDLVNFVNFNSIQKMINLGQDLTMWSEALIDCDIVGLVLFGIINSIMILTSSVP